MKQRESVRVQTRYDQARSTHHLSCSHADGLDCELATAHVEQVLQARPQEVDYENVMEPLLPEVVYLGYASCWQRGCSD